MRSLKSLTESITVTATSSDSSTPTSKTYTIAVTNVDDNATTAVTDSNTAANAVDENSVVGTVVAFVIINNGTVGTPFGNGGVVEQGQIFVWI